MTLRNMSTPESRAFWESVAQASRECRSTQRYHLPCMGAECHMGNGQQTCAQVIREARKERAALHKSASMEDQPR